MSIITTATTKGGAGKTTVAQVIIGAVHDLGYTIGVIDTDENQTLSSWLQHTTKMAIDFKVVLDESQVVERFAFTWRTVRRSPSLERRFGDHGIPGV